MTSVKARAVRFDRYGGRDVLYVTDIDMPSPGPGEVLPLRGGPVVEIVRVAEPSVHLAVAAALNGPQFAALQLVYADDRGHWPWETRFRGGRGGQPVLGARTAVTARPARRRQ